MCVNRDSKFEITYFLTKDIFKKYVIRLSYDLEMTTSERISLRIEKKKKEKLEELAKKLDTTSSELLRELIENLIRLSSLYDSLTLETIFSTNPLLTIGDFLQLPNQGEKVWNQWFREEVDSTITNVVERDVKKE